MTSGIYQIRNMVNGKCYIGSSVDTEGRWWTHQWQLANGSHHNVYLQRSWDKYGQDAFVFEVLEEIESEFLLDREQSYLDVSFDGLYNICPKAGSTLGAVNGPLSEEHRLKISRANKGRIVSEETRKKMSEARMGRSPSEESRRKRMGRQLSEDHKRKIAEGNRGKIVSEETRQKLSKAGKGRPKSEETRRRASEGAKRRAARGVSEETRKKLSESGRRRWEAFRAAKNSSCAYSLQPHKTAAMPMRRVVTN